MPPPQLAEHALHADHFEMLQSTGHGCVLQSDARASLDWSQGLPAPHASWSTVRCVVCVPVPHEAVQGVIVVQSLSWQSAGCGVHEWCPASLLVQKKCASSRRPPVNGSFLMSQEWQSSPPCMCWYLPLGQATQWIDPSRSWNLPFGHIVQCALASTARTASDKKKPLVHDVHDALPLSAVNLPLGQEKHCSSLVRPVSALNLPRTQGTQPSCPFISWYVPFAHSVHNDAPALENRPSAQAMHF
jgi:hypothetical protein